jgi:hypothetical protein
MIGLTRAWRKTGHTGRDRGVADGHPANGTELTSSSGMARKYGRCIS